MKKQFKIVAGKIIASGEEKSRVVQVSFDVELAPGATSDEFIEAVDKAINSNAASKFNIVGEDYVEDLTDVYERDYSDLLKYRN